MRSRAPLTLRLLAAAGLAAVVVACQDSQTPWLSPGGSPTLAISDGAHGAVETRNTDVFFYPPLVANPSGQFGFGDRPANPNLFPVARICRLNATEAVPNPTPLECVETLSPDLAMGFDQAGQFYMANLKDGGFALNNDSMYRIEIFVGPFSLAYRDIDPDPSPPTSSCDTVAFCQFNNTGSSSLPIKVRIESAALCFHPGSNGTPGTFNLPCATAQIGVGGSVTLQDSGEVIATVDLKPGGGGSGAALLGSALSGTSVSVVTLTACPSPSYLNPAFIDLPTYSDCVDIETNPPLTAIGAIGVASLCQALDFAAAARLSEAQRRRITILNLTDKAKGVVVALPDAKGNCPAPTPAPSRIGVGPLDRLLRLAGAAWQSVREHAIAWLGPNSLWASLICDVGCGGWGFESPVQAALPAKMDYHADNPGGALGTSFVSSPVTAKVQVTDAGNPPEPVAGATVHFTVTGGGGSVSAASDTTGPDGVAEVTWTRGPDPGLNTLEASGRGIADPSCATDATFPCGPQGVFAPDHLDSAAGRVTLGIGRLTFTATGCVVGQGTGSADVDGTFGATEWQCAAQFPFTANVSGGSTPATLYVMNDATTLYLAVRVERSSTDKVNSLQFNFDNNGSCPNMASCTTGVAEVYDDVLSFDGGAKVFTDAFLTLKCTNSSQSSCWQSDLTATPPGNKDGQAAVGNNGTYTTYEVSHPLSGDAYDFARGAGQPLGLFLTLQQGNGAQGNTQWPQFRQYLEIVVQP